MGSKSAEDRRHDVHMAWLAFFLTTIVGGAFTWWVQRIQEASRLTEQRRAEATRLFNEISPLMDKRLYLWRKLAWSLENGENSEELAPKRGAYRAIVDEWNFGLNRRRALICRYFGQEAADAFEGKIANGFISLQDLISDQIKQVQIEPKKKPLNLAERADSLNVEVYLFNSKLAESIRTGQVGDQGSGKECWSQFKEGELII